MKNSKVLKVIGVIVCICSLFVSCTSNSITEEVEKEVVKKDEMIELNIWSHYGGLEEAISSFEKNNPNVKVNLKVFTYEEYVEEYKKSMLLTEGKADLFIIDSNQYGDFIGIDGLENLLKDEYTAKSYEADFDKELWELGKSLDKKQLLGLPIASAPLMTYYRKDILEQYGFPGESEELAEFMKDEDNWFEMAEKLRENDKFLIQWYGELVRISSTNMPYFDKDLNYQRGDSDFKAAIKRAIRAHELSLGLYADIWTETGLKALKEDKLVMLFLGSWGANDLSNLVPEQAGKWRVTSLPFDEYGWNNASIISMAKNSTKKEVAWNFIEHIVFKHMDSERVGNVPGYLPFREKATTTKTNDFLGGQNEQELYKKSLQKTSEYPVTPLDAEMFGVWDNITARGLENGLTADQIMRNIEIEIESNFSEKIKILKSLNK
ncbi:MAG: ABC transporter substrate-binding protein [Sarcina sp.]